MRKYNQKPIYRADIDGLRALAVLAVVGFHASPNQLRGGFIGVDVFFVISGFLISNIIFHSIQCGNFSFFNFYIHRIKRIFPALIIVLTSSYIFGKLTLLSDEYKQLGKHIAASAVFAQNFTLWKEAGYFDLSSELKPLMHLWSLAIEEQFYLIYPLIIWFTWRAGFNILLTITVLGIISFGLNLRGIIHDPIGTFFLPQTRFWELLAGAVLAYLQLHPRAWLTTLKQRTLRSLFHTTLIHTPPALGWDGKILFNLLAILGSIFLIGAVVILNSGLPYPGKATLMPVLGACLLISAGPQTWINRNILSQRLLVFIGLISYPLYLWHWPLLSFARIIEGETPSLTTRIVAVVSGFILAWLTYRLIERPIRFGTPTRLKIVSLFLALTAIGNIGFIAYQSEASQPLQALLLRENLLCSSETKYCSGNWYLGKESWLFLGNDHNQTTEKLILRKTPSEQQIQKEKSAFTHLAQIGKKYGTSIILLVAPDKERVYTEYLPDHIKPSPQRYVDFFLDSLRTIPNLFIYDPIIEFYKHKSDETLYYIAGTHWNAKGALLAWQGLSKLMSLPDVPVYAQIAPTIKDSDEYDLIKISGLRDFSLPKQDHFELIWTKEQPLLTERPSPIDRPVKSFATGIIYNEQPLVDKSAWIIGDSFVGTNGHPRLSPLINATFKEIYYVSHWSQTLHNGELSKMLEKAEHKPDYIIIERIERSF